MKFTRSINNAIKNTQIAKDLIKILAPKGSDYFLSPDGKKQLTNAPILLTKVDNTKPFTFIVKVTPQFHDCFDAGALFIYVNNHLWQKFAFEMDEEKNTRIVSVRTIETSDDNNHSVIIQNSVYLKISSDGHQIGFYYSLDKEIWYLARVYKNNYPKTIYLGLSSQSPIGDGISTVFEDITFSDRAIKDFRMGA